MSLPKRIKVSEQLAMIGGVLQDNLKSEKAVVEACANQRRLWERIFSMSLDDKPRVLIAWDGEVSRGAFGQRNTLNRVDRSWVVVVLGGRSFDQNPGAQVGAFVDFVEKVRQLCRAILGISEEPVDFMSTKPLPGVAQPNAANTFLDGYVITFTTANDIPAVTALAPGQQPEG